MGSSHLKDKGQHRRRVSGLQNVRTAVKARMRTKPVTESQDYLDMWTLARERARWGRLKRQAEKTIEEIEKELKKLQKTLLAVEDRDDGKDDQQPQRKVLQENFGTFRVDY